MHKEPSIHVLIILGRVGRYWGNQGETFDERIRITEKALATSDQLYDQMIITGGHEFSDEKSNAELLYEALAKALAKSPHPPDTVMLLKENCKNQVALIKAVDIARMNWPKESILFHVVTSEYAVRRMKDYLHHHIDQLTKLHAGRRSPRQLYWSFYESEDHPIVPFRNRVREWIKRKIDLRRPDPIPLVQVN